MRLFYIFLRFLPPSLYCPGLLLSLFTKVRPYRRSTFDSLLDLQIIDAKDVICVTYGVSNWAKIVSF